MLSSILPAAGRLLISEPFMMDPNFRRSVILLTEYGKEGAVGFVLNHTAESLLSDALPGIPYSEMPLYIGGPVGNDTLHFIHRCPEKISGGLEITKGVYWGGNFNTIKELVAGYQLKNDEIKFFMGYSGWMPDQLNDEIKQESWIVTDKINPDMVFAQHEDALWRETVISLGQRYAHIANFPENPTLN